MSINLFEMAQALLPGASVLAVIVTVVGNTYYPLISAKIIRILAKNRPYWYWSVTGMAAQFTSCGAFQKAQEHLPYW